MSVKSRAGKVAHNHKLQIGVAVVLALGAGIASGAASGNAKAVKMTNVASQASVDRDSAQAQRDLAISAATSSDSRRATAQAAADAAPAKAKAAADADNASRSADSRGGTYHPGDNSHSFFRDLVDARRGDADSPDRLRTNNQEQRALGSYTTGGAAEFAPPGYLDIVPQVRAGSMFASLLHQEALPTGLIGGWAGRIGITRFSAG